MRLNMVNGKWILGIILVFGLITATNLIDRNNFERMRNAVVTIYEDRLVAKEILFELSSLIHQKEVAILTNDSAYFQQENKAVNAAVAKSLERFGATELTREELSAFNELKTQFAKLERAEQNYINNGDRQGALSAMRTIEARIEQLARIQMDEGRRHMIISQNAMDSIEFFTQIELYVLLFIAIAVQVLVLYKPKEKEAE